MRLRRGVRERAAGEGGRQSWVCATFLFAHASNLAVLFVSLLLVCRVFSVTRSSLALSCSTTSRSAPVRSRSLLVRAGSIRRARSRRAARSSRRCRTSRSTHPRTAQASSRDRGMMRRNGREGGAEPGPGISQQFCEWRRGDRQAEPHTHACTKTTIQTTTKIKKKQEQEQPTATTCSGVERKGAGASRCDLHRAAVRP